MRKVILWILAIIIVIGALGYGAFQFSPWPSVLLIRHAFEKDAARVRQAQEKHVPAGVSAMLDIRYDPDDGDARLDVFYPTAIEGSDKILPAIVWIHGGGWISGSKDDNANYLRILAGQGYAVVGVDYTVAPSATYPTPLRQVNAALGFLAGKGSALHVDAARIVLAGDSAGAQIAAQVANMISVPSYAEAIGIVPALKRGQLKGAILFCGAYDVGLADLEGSFGGFLRTVMWSYSGRKDFKNDPAFVTVSVANYVTPDFPPTFISVGNADPLGPQSVAFAKALAAKGVMLDELFFAADHTPPLPHEYQFNLDNEAGETALKRSLEFLAKYAPASG